MITVAGKSAYGAPVSDERWLRIGGDSRGMDLRLRRTALDPGGYLRLGVLVGMLAVGAVTAALALSLATPWRQDRHPYGPGDRTGYLQPR
jgi:hypothetical protein